MNRDQVFYKMLGEAFTPTSPAIHNYINRVIEDQEFMEALSQKGFQIIVYGPTGVGKTSMVWSALERSGLAYQLFPFDYTITKENLCAKIMNKLGFEKRTQNSTTKELSASSQAEAGATFWHLVSFKGNFGVNHKKADSEITVPFFNDADIDAVVDGLRRTRCVLYFDDLEKVRDPEIRLMISHMGKKLSDGAAADDSGAKIIYAGIAQEVRNLVDVDASLRGRLADQFMQPLKDDEVRRIFTTGWRKCGMNWSRIDLDKVINMCCGYARYAHWIGQESAKSAYKADRNEITDADIDQSYQVVISRFRDDFQSRFDKATNHKSGLRLRENILFAIATSQDIEVHTDFILQKVSNLTGVSLKATQISGPLGELKTETRGNILESGRTTGHHRLTDLMMKPYIRMIVETRLQS